MAAHLPPAEALEARMLLASVLDPSFGYHGVLDFPSFADETFLQTFVQAPDGSITAMVRGTTYTYENETGSSFDSFKLTRYAGGNFSTIVPTDSSDALERGRLFAQDDNKLLLVMPNVDQLLLTRYNTDITEDAAFGTGGTAEVHLDAEGNIYDRAFDAAISADGKITIASAQERSDGSGYVLAVVRFNADGTPDTSFDSDGEAYSTLQAGDAAQGVEITPSGKIVVGGNQTGEGEFLKQFVARFNADATADTSFDNDGHKLFAITQDDSFAHLMALQTDGKVLLGGHAYLPGDEAVVITRLNADGSLDTSFADDGVFQASGTDNYIFLEALLIDSASGKIVTVGTGYSGARVSRLNPDGSFDSTFGDGGSAILSIPLATTLSAQLLGADHVLVSTYSVGVARIGARPDIAITEHVITFTGTDAADTFSVTHSGNKLNVNRNGITSSYDFDLELGINTIDIETHGGNDVITYAGELTAFIETGDGDDTITTLTQLDVPLPHANSVNTGAGNDTISYRSDDDVTDGINTGAGNDRLTVISSERSRLQISLGDGDNAVTLGNGANLVYCGEGNDTIIGGGALDEDDDTLRDTIFGGDGDDFLQAGPSGAELHGEAGNDSLIGSDAGDALEGGEGNDSIDAGAGNDVILDDGGRDTIHAGAGNDHFGGYYNNDGSLIDLGDGDDGADFGSYFVESISDMTVLGGDGNDYVTIYTAQAADGNLIDLGDGDDRSTIYAPGATILCGGGDDLVHAGGFGDGHSTIVGGDGDDTLFSGDCADYLYGNAGRDRIYGGGGSDLLSGGGGRDKLFGQDGKDRLYGGDGNDFLIGAGGDDRIFGGDGIDKIFAGTGNNTIAGGAGADMIFRSGSDAGDLEEDPLDLLA